MSIFPSCLGVPMRRLLGFKIGKGVKISFGSIILSKEVSIGNYTKIGPLVFVKGKNITIGEHCVIKPFTFIITHTILLGNIVQISPFTFIIGNQLSTSILQVGDRTSILPFCWLEPGEGLQIGKNVGIGGHTLIFTHGVWSNYLKGGPVSHGPVIIKDNVWLAWRTFIMPGVTIEQNSIVSACSFVITNVPKNVVVSGNPARKIAEAHKAIGVTEMEDRFCEILHQFNIYINNKYGIKSIISDGQLTFLDFRILYKNFNLNAPQNNDLVFLLYEEQIEVFKNISISRINFQTEEAFLIDCSVTYLHKEFIGFLRRYGIRIFIN